MPSLKHTHTYVKYKKRPGYWRCADPKCSHYTDHESCVGKASLCNVCGNEFVLTYADLQNVKPRCLNCSETKEAREFRKVKAIAETFLSGLSEE